VSNGGSKNPTLVVLDNANYHNVKTEDTVCPNFSQKKAVLQNYLTQHNIPFSATILLVKYFVKWVYKFGIITALF
jgi:hypothetical protein